MQMKFVLYDILFHIVFVVLSPYLAFKVMTRPAYRDAFFERFGFIGYTPSHPSVWIHAVSVGETRAVLPLVRLIKERYPDIKIVFSTTTPTGRSLAQKEAGFVDSLIYFPFDFPWAVRRVVEAIKPVLFVVVEKEIWPNTYRVLKDRDIPVVVVNGTISERSFRWYRAMGFFFRDVFSRITVYCAGTEEDGRRATALGIPPERVVTTGNIKFDMDDTYGEEGYFRRLREDLAIDESDLVIVAGSTHQGEEEMILRVFRRLREDFKGLVLVLAPRHPERFDEVESLIRDHGLDCGRRTKGGGAEVILLDTLGELRGMYGVGDVTLVGGSLVDGVGGHNLLEPACLGKPVVYGTYLGGYATMAGLLENGGGGIRVRDEEELFKVLKRLLSDGEAREEMGRSARKVVESNRGALEKTLRVIDGFLRRE